MKNKFLEHQKFRIITMTVLGFIVSLLLFAVLIALGFSNYSSSSQEEHIVNFLGFPIFTITNDAKTAHNGTMMFLGFIFVTIFITVGEAIAARMKNKNQENKK